MKYFDQQLFEATYRKKIVEEYPNRAPETPLVSVCVQTYQHHKYIAQCLQSIVDQVTDFAYEIIVGDDESSDGTREICLEFARKYPEKIRLMLHHRVNNIIINGAFTGRYNLIHNYFHARGKYIAWCEGDDYWTDPLKLQKQIRLHEQYPDCVASIHNAFVDDEQNGRSLFYEWNKEKKVDPEFLLVEAIAGFPTAAVVFNKIIAPIPECLFQIRSADVGISFLLLNVGSFYYLPDNMCVYRIHSGGIYSASRENALKLNKYEQENILFGQCISSIAKPKVIALLQKMQLKSCEKMLYRAFSLKNREAFIDAAQFYAHQFPWWKHPKKFLYLIKTKLKFQLNKN